MKQNRLDLILLAGLCAILYFMNTWGYDLWPADEPRFAQVAREMMESHDYLLPHINGEPYKEKPPLLFWAINAASLPFGTVNEFSARAPSAVAAILIVLLTYALASRLYGRQVALWSGLMLATTLFFWWEARSVRTDMILTATMAATLYFFWRWHSDRQRLFLIAFYAAVAAGCFVKGPPALVFPLLLVIAFYWRRREDRRKLHYFLGLLLAMAPVLLWFLHTRLAVMPTETMVPTATVPSATANPHASMWAEIVRMTAGRLGGVSKAQPPWYYIINLPICLLPWALFLPWVLPWVWKRRKEDDAMRLLLSWVVPSFIFFSITIAKRGVYLLPLYPALAILMARAILDLMDSSHDLWRKRTAYVWGLSLLGIAGAVVGAHLKGFHELVTPGTVTLAIVSAGMGIYTLITAVKTSVPRLHVTFTAEYAVLSLLIALFFFPALNEYKGASDICAPLRILAEQNATYRLYALGFSREEYIYYSKHFHKPVLNDLLPIKLDKEIKMRDMVKQQRTLRKAIAKAVDEVPVANLVKPTQAELQKLHETVHAAVEQAKADPALIKIFEQSLTDVIRQIMDEFDQSDPAFMFIQEEDWKWLLALFPQLAEHPLIHSENVGRRHMLLLANTAGKKLADEKVK